MLEEYSSVGAPTLGTVPRFQHPAGTQPPPFELYEVQKGVRGH